MPNEWHLLKNRGAIDLTIDKLRLPYFAQVINSVKVENVVFIARGKNNFIYSSIQIKGTNLDMDEIDNLKLYKGERGNIELNSSFELSMGEAELLNLEELMLIVKYGF